MNKKRLFIALLPLPAPLPHPSTLLPRCARARPPRRQCKSTSAACPLTSRFRVCCNFFWSRYSKTPPKQQHPPIPKLMATDMGDNDWFCTNLTETLAPKVCSVNDFSACKDQIKQQCSNQYSPCSPCVPTLTAGFSSSLQDGGQQDGGQQARPN